MEVNLKGGLGFLPCGRLWAFRLWMGTLHYRAFQLVNMDKPFIFVVRAVGSVIQVKNIVKNH